MQKKFIPTLLLSILIFVTGALADPPPTLYAYRAEVTEVTDGDTIRADISLGFDVWKHATQLRLLEVYAPETRTTNLTEKKNGMLVKEFQTTKDKDDKYGRYLVVVWAGGQDINAAIRGFMERNNLKPAGKGVKP